VVAGGGTALLKSEEESSVVGDLDSTLEDVD
jgi:hypothetical protein